MKKIILTGLALCAFLLMPAMSQAVPLTIDLNGQDGQGNFTLMVPQTSSNTSNTVYQLDLLHKGGPLREGSVYALYVALGTPDGKLLFVTTIQGQNSPIIPFRKPVFVVSSGLSIPGKSVFSATLPLFPIGQAVVNATPPGTYTFFAVYVDLSFLCPLCGFIKFRDTITTGDIGSIPLSDLASHIVSNVAQASLEIVSAASTVNVTLINQDIQNVHIKPPAEPFGARNRILPGTQVRRTVQFPTLGSGFLPWVAGRNGKVLARTQCLIRFDIPNRVTWTGSRLVCR